MDQRQLLLLQRLQASYIALSGRLRAQVDEFVSAQWNGMEHWHDADMVHFQNRVLPVVLAAQKQAANATNAYLSRAENTASGVTAKTPSLDLTAVTGEALRGVSMTDLYMRPQAVLNYTLSTGSTVTEAVTAGLDRLRSITATDMQLAHSHTVAQQGKRPYYKRVLTGGENCALCVIASTQRYKQGRLKPIHPHCDCSSQEEFGDDPGQVLDRGLLDQTNSLMNGFVNSDGKSLTDGSGHTIQLLDGSTNAADYRHLIVTHENSEIGPVLAWRGDAFRDGAEAKALAA